MCALQASSIVARIHIEGRLRHVQHDRARASVAEYGLGSNVPLELAEPTPDPARQDRRDTRPALVPGGDRPVRPSLPGLDETPQRGGTDARLIRQEHEYASRFGRDGVNARDQRTRNAVLPTGVPDDSQVAVIPGQQRAQA